MCAVPRPVVPDPAVDGWTSEAFSELAQKELKDLLYPLGAIGSDWKPVKGAFALLPQVKEAAQTNTVTVWRGGEAAVSKAERTLQAALEPVAARFAADGARHLKVKTVAVKLPETPGQGTAETTHLIHLDGPTSSGRCELNLTWKASWQSTSAGKPGDLISLRCLQWEEVQTKAAQPWFSDQTKAVLSGAPDAAQQFAGGNGFYRLRLQASLPFFKFGHHGLALADVNGDGLEDVYVCQPGGLPNRLLLHQPDHTVKDGAADWGVDLLDSCQFALFADLDNDGDPDLAVATVGPLVIFENAGQRFIPRIRLPAVLNAYGLTACDYDLDGDTDIYATRYFPSEGEGGELAVPMPHFDANNGGPNILVKNDGSAGGNWLSFADATAETGLNVNNRRFSYASVWDDFNNDSLPDLYVANDFGRNNLYLQSRGAGGKPRFNEVTDEAGLADGAFGMSASSGDFNRDGWPDIHLGAMFSSAGSRITTQDRFRPELPMEVRQRFQRLARGNTLFANTGETAGHFRDVSESAGITLGRWSWASLFGDIDNDAWPDLLVANGFVTGEILDDL